MGLLPNAVARVFGHSKDRTELEAAARALHDARSDLRESVSGLGQEVWGMVETGDPLGALVHGAKRARFHRAIEEGHGK
jgi:hypothetical protein